MHLDNLFNIFNKSVSKKLYFLSFAYMVLFSNVLFLDANNIKIDNDNDKNWNRAYAITVPMATAVGYSAYEIASRMFQKRNAEILIPDERTNEIIKAISSFIGLGVGWNTIKYGTPIFQIALTKQKLTNKQAREVLKLVQTYLTYLTVLKVLQYELQAILENGLDTAKYHAAGVESRLQILDAAFYLLKNNCLISQLEQNGRYSQEFIINFCNKIKQNINEIQDVQLVWDNLMSQLEFLSKFDYKYDRQALLDSIQLQKQHKLFDLLSKYFIHLDVFISGFNRGIDVINEAHLVNTCAHQLKNLFCLEMTKVKNKLNEENKVLKRYIIIENIFMNWLNIKLI